MKAPSRLAAWLAVIGASVTSVHGQATSASQSLSGSLAPSSSLSSTTTTLQAPSASSTPYLLAQDIPVLSPLPLPSDETSPFTSIFFQFEPQRTQDGTGFLDTYISVSLCSGPSIPPYDLANSSQLASLELSTSQASRATYVRAIYTTDPAEPKPSPGRGSEVILHGGQASFTVKGSQVVQSIYLALWSPFDSRGTFGGNWNVRVAASNRAYSQTLSPTSGLYWQDTDGTRSLLQSFSFNSALYRPSGLPDLNLRILPSTGQFALDPFFNSSICALEEAVSRWNSSSNPEANEVRVNLTTSRRGGGTSLGALLGNDDPTRVVLFEANGLQRNTNYTAWMILNGNATMGTVQGQTMWPAVKFKTKRADNCRLVYNVPFCPNVGYSIPVNPAISTNDALSAMDAVVTPNYLNFTRTLSTFPCNDPSRGAYSSLATCDDCRAAYLDWLCSVTMPRCTDSVDLANATDGSGTMASQDGLDLSLANMQTNDEALPYIVNRGSGGNDNSVQPSRQPYIDSDLRPGSYGELLPCIYGCHFVERACPAPIFKWACPDWGITAQRDYGTFGDADQFGMVAEAEEVVPPTTSAWGGPSRYVAQDGFGRTYCNAMRVDRLLVRQMVDDSNADKRGERERKKNKTSAAAPPATSLGATFALVVVVGLASAFLLPGSTAW